MKGLIVFSIMFLMGGQNAPQLTISELIAKASESESIEISLLDGEFAYYSSNEESGVYKSAFVGDRRYGVINYISTSGANVLDSIYVGNQRLAADKKYDPLSISLYSIEFKHCQYICLMGKAVSASGSGVQITYYTLLELDKANEIIDSKSFESRFGIIENLGDHNKDGRLDYLKVTNGDKMGEFLGKLYDLTTEKPIGDNFISLSYLGNDNFEITGCNWFKPIGCN